MAAERWRRLLVGTKGASYQNAIKAYVRLLNENGMVAILDLHWSDGRYPVQPVHVDDLARICVEAGGETRREAVPAGPEDEFATLFRVLERG